MKTTVKRTLALLLATASMASVLTACGSSGSAAADTSTDTQAAFRYLGTWPGTVPYQGVWRDGHRDRVRLYAV